MIIGIDDAGRGPAIGPMILAGIAIDEKQEQEIKNLEVKDSKLLSPKKRNSIFQKLKSFRHHIEKTFPEEIDACENLNTLEAMKSAMIINALTKNSEEKIKVIIDCPSVNCNAWAKELKSFLNEPKKIELVVEHKADFNYPIVSAASIIAKETREEEVLKLKRELKIDFGSGYPSDPKTIDFLKRNFSDEKFAKIIRHSWQTIKDIKKNSSQRKLI
jgi:ribonuclease HII